MEQVQEKKYVCKFCNKRYPCGKSLGGHIRTHMNNENSSAEAEEGAAELSINKHLSSSNARNIKRVAEYEAGGNQSAAYGLRENPKKTKRFSDSGNTSLLKDMICKECGKGFQSLKAVCGHMACHSEKERVFQKFEDHSGNSEKQKLIMDSQSETETSAPSRRRRSKRVIRYKTIGVYSNNSVSLANGSSSVSEIEQEQEEDLVSEVGENRADRALTKYDLRRSAKNDYHSPEYLCNNSPKGSKYECLTCKKTFDSHRALGGHRASHTKVNDFSESIHESGEDSSFPVPMTDHSKVTKSSYGKSLSTTTRVSSGNAEKRLGSKKKKGHECPFCFRVFKSGQALGGHKRSHFVGGSEDRTLVIRQDSPDQMPALIDLNLPAPVEEDTMGNAGFMPW
ncbi:hypothetical protein REPUB_Repub01dG0023200 [Reevesia pubescens]